MGAPFYSWSISQELYAIAPLVINPTHPSIPGFTENVCVHAHTVDAKKQARTVILQHQNMTADSKTGSVKARSQ